MTFDSTAQAFDNQVETTDHNTNDHDAGSNERDDYEGDDTGNGSNDDVDARHETTDQSQRSQHKGHKQDKKEGEPTNETPERFTKEETEQVEAFIKKMKLPKGVSYLLTDSGDLNFIVPISGKKYRFTPSEIMSGFNLNQAGTQKLNEGKKIISEFQEYLGQIKQNPSEFWNLAKKLGHDPHELAQQLLQEKLEELETPEEIRELKKLQKENEQFKKQEEERQRMAEQQKFQAEHQRYVNEAAKRFDKEIPEAMIKHGFKSSDPKTKSEIMTAAIGKMMLARQNGHDLNADDAVHLAKQDWQRFVLGVFDDLNDQQIVDMVPERIVKAIRKADLARLDQGVPPTSNSMEYGQPLDLSQHEDPDHQSRKSGRKKQSINEFFENL